MDLHINELVDTTAGMNNSAMLEMQLDVVRKTMDAHSRRIGQKIVFIHGKGEGVLRKAVLSLLKKEYPSATLQDASFREYGFGATLVTIHNDNKSSSAKN
ncbi:MAG: Smr/MutS family protein [Muribaculaceae bacterium]|nr:Smr/MutS family protein [Muribaculaceae bacterium]